MATPRVITHNPLRPTAIQKLLEMIGRVRLYPRLLIVTALDPDINQTTWVVIRVCKKICMHAMVCLSRASQPKSAGNAAKSSQFIGQFSWFTGDPIGLKGLRTVLCTNTTSLQSARDWSQESSTQC